MNGTDDNEKRRLAVALDYERGSSEAPRVVAKGYGHVADAIVAAAEANGVAIEANPLLAEALAGVPLDDSIPVELYEAVAAVIGVVLRARERVLSDQAAAS